MATRTFVSSDFTVIDVTEDLQQVLVVHEILRHQNRAALLDCAGQLAIDTVPCLTRQVVRGYGFSAEWAYRWVVLVEVVGSGGGLTEKFTSAVAEKLADGYSDESDNVRTVFEAL